MTTTVEPAGAVNGTKPAADDGRAAAADEALARQLAERARAEGLSLAGPGGLLGRLTKLVLESALDGEMDAHLGYGRHDPAGRDGGNSRNGKRVKTVPSRLPSSTSTSPSSALTPPAEDGNGAATGGRAP